jgi:YebC/PmpR family DNA-binding regulatory protein
MMSGHSKWSTIKHKKAAQDSKRGKLFSMISRQIRVAVQEGKSGDADQNPTLRLALEKARAANMPKENIQRAIDRGLGKSKSGQVFEEIVYEAYAPGGVGVMVWVVTDNRNRTGSEIRSIIDKHGGSMGAPGSTAYLFEKKDDGSYGIRIPLELNNQEENNKVVNMLELIEAHEDVEMVLSNLAGLEEA